MQNYNEGNIRSRGTYEKGEWGRQERIQFYNDNFLHKYINSIIPFFLFNLFSKKKSMNHFLGEWVHRRRTL